MSKVLLIGCGKSKRDVLACPAEELYCGALFLKRLAFARSARCPFLILSARYGLIEPGSIVMSYDKSLKDLSPLNQVAWSVGVVTQFCEYLDNDSLTFSDLRKVHCEIHAGADYAERLMDLLIGSGFSASWPVKGMSQGEQMAFYTRGVACHG